MKYVESCSEFIHFDFSEVYKINVKKNLSVQLQVLGCFIGITKRGRIISGRVNEIYEYLAYLLVLIAIIFS